MRKTTLVASALTTMALFTLGAGCTGTPTTTVTNTNSTKTTTTTTTTNTNVAPAVFNAVATDAVILADVNGQWATTATASTEYGTDSWSAKQATGKPNVTAAGDDINAWAPAEKNKGLETLELSYAKAVYAEGVRIRENLGDGSVTKIELKDTAGTYHTIWTGTDATTGLNYLQVAVAKTAYQVNGVKVTFDTTLSPNDWSEVDAVQLVGE